MNRTTQALGLLAALLLSACNKEPTTGTAVEMAAPELQAKTFSDEPWLRERLPADSIAYARIPSPWRALFGPAGKSTDRMFRSQSYVAAIAQLRERFAKDSVVGSAAGPVAALVHRLNSPIEIAVIAAGRMASPAANVLVSAHIEAANAAELGALLGPVLGGDQAPAVSFDAQSFATVDAAGTPLQLHYDVPTQRLTVLAGLYANLDSLRKLREQLLSEPVGPRPLLALEREIDDVGQGLVLWADMQALRPLLAASSGADPAAQAVLQQLKSVAVGWGSVAGQGHLSWRAELGGAAWTRYLPQSERHFDVRTSGATRFALTVALPGSADLARMREAFAADAGPDGVKALQEAEQKLLDASGLSVAEWISPFGPELVSFADDAGEFTAIRLRDAKALARLRGVLVDKLGARYASVELAGNTIHHLSLSVPTGTGTPPPAPDNAVEARLLTLYQRIGTHLFWIEQDGWMVFAPVPQALMDRLSAGTDRSVQDLLTAAGVAPGALVSVSGQSQHIARTLYHAYLGLALAVGDLGNAPFDIFSVPSAQQLGLPLETSMGLGLSATADHLSLDASYAQHPFEFVSGGGSMAAVAVAGIVAAIAIPAYQDYTVRATVAGALAQASALKVAVAEHNASTGALPDTGADIEMELPLTSSDGKAEVNLDRGAILVTFTDTADKLAGNHLYLLPSQASGENLQWRCGYRAASDEHLLVSTDPDLVLSDIEERYLPAECRAE